MIDAFVINLERLEICTKQIETWLDLQSRNKQQDWTDYKACQEKH